MVFQRLKYFVVEVLRKYFYLYETIVFQSKMTDVFRGSIEVNLYEFMENFSCLRLVCSPFQ